MKKKFNKRIITFLIIILTGIMTGCAKSDDNLNDNVSYTMKVVGTVLDWTDLTPDNPEQKYVFFEVDAENTTLKRDDIVIIKTSTKEMKGKIITIISNTTDNYENGEADLQSISNKSGTFLIYVQELEEAIDKNLIKDGDKVGVLKSN